MNKFRGALVVSIVSLLFITGFIAAACTPAGAPEAGKPPAGPPDGCAREDVADFQGLENRSYIQGYHPCLESAGRDR